MFERFRRAQLVWPLLATIAATTVLFSLGNWQWGRMHWKQGLEAQLREAQSKPSVPLKDLIAKATRDGNLDFDAIRFRNVLLEGEYVLGSNLYVWNPKPSGPEWTVIGAVRTPSTAYDGRGQANVLTIVGSVLDNQRGAFHQSNDLAGPISQRGRIRIDSPNTSAPQADVSANRWYTRDLSKMSKALADSGTVSGRVAPFFVELTDTVAKGALINRDLDTIKLFNRHFEYALTWWGLAVTALIMFIVFAYGRVQKAA